MTKTLRSWTFDVRCSMFALLPLLAGCATPLTPKTPKVHFIGTETLKTMGSELFLECVEPEAREMTARKLQRSDMDRPLYYSDKANRDQPAFLHIPSVYTTSLDAFRQVESQGYGGPPRIVIQLRERQKVLKAKVYHVTTPLYRDTNELVKKQTETERYPRYYDWNWYPDCEVRARRPIRLKIEVLEIAGGLPYKTTGLLDNQGSIQVNIAPFIDTGATREDGLRFVFSCPEEGLHAEVHVPQDVFDAYREPGGAP